MNDFELDEMDFTNMAWESLYQAVDDKNFSDRDAELIYTSLTNKMKLVSFGDYLRRYIYRRAELKTPFLEVPITEYQEIIKCSFADNETPASFEPNTAKLSQLSRNWLTQSLVKRKVVFLLGFGLSMSVEDVNQFLTKALLEQEINPKDPFEVICFYCLKNGYNYLKFKKLYDTYKGISPQNLDIMSIIGDQTVFLNANMNLISNDITLMNYLASMKVDKNVSCMSESLKYHFFNLYDEAKTCIAKLYTETDDRKRKYSKEDITESDFEHIICSAVPVDRHGNLTPAKKSKLNEQFKGRRFSRQRISEIIAGETEITRFDLLTLNFFIYSQRLDTFTTVKERYSSFFNSSNKMLDECFLGEIYVQNAYECFLLMCMLSDDPLGTFADVWELSYVE